MTSRVSPKPSWTNDESEPEFNSCAKMLLKMAQRLAGRFFKGRGIVCGFSKEDLAGEALVHFFVKFRAGKFKNYSPAKMWAAAKECMWHRMLDVINRPSNQSEMQAGGLVEDEPITDSDEILETLDAGKGGAWGQSLRRSEIRALEDFVDSLLSHLPEQMRLLLSLRFGLYRADDFGSEFPVQGEPLCLEVLVSAGFGESTSGVHRRVQEALERLRALALEMLGK